MAESSEKTTFSDPSSTALSPQLLLSHFIAFAFPVSRVPALRRFNAPGTEQFTMPSTLALLPPAAAARRLLSPVPTAAAILSTAFPLLRRDFNCTHGPALGRISVRPCDQPVRYMQLFEGQFIAEPFAITVPAKGILLSH